MQGFQRALANGLSTVPWRLAPEVHLFLTDRLACPRCGPDFGLILLADQVENQRVTEGRLGCPNCRDQYPIKAGFGDLRVSPRSPLEVSKPGAKEDSLDPEEALRFAASLGVTSGPGTILVVGPASRYSKALADLVGGIEVVALDGDGLCREESEGVSRMVASTGIPFFSGSFRGVLVSGKSTEGDLKEAVRVLAPSGRVVVLQGYPGADQYLSALGLEIILDDDGVLVAQSNQAEPQPLITLRGL